MSETNPTDTSGNIPFDLVGDRTIEEVMQRLRDMLSEAPPHSEERERVRAENIMLLLTWYASIRWWVAPGCPARFRGDWKDVFHPWVENFRFPLPSYLDPRDKLPEFATNPEVPVEEAARTILKAQAEIQEQACVTIGNRLELEAASIEDSSRSAIVCDRVDPDETDSVPEPKFLRRYANEFKDLSQKFRSALCEPQQQGVSTLRWNICLGWGLQAAK